jgi:hypothetical protein
MGTTLSRIETIAEGVTLYLGDCREILPTTNPILHSSVVPQVLNYQKDLLMQQLAC